MEKKNQITDVQPPRNDEASEDFLKAHQDDERIDSERDADELVHEGKINETSKENEEVDPDELIHNIKPHIEKNEGEQDIDDLMHR